MKLYLSSYKLANDKEILKRWLKDNGNKVSLENAYFGIKTIDDLKTALTKNGRYQLVADIEVAKNETLTIANGVEAVLNLNGKTIKSTADKTVDANKTVNEVADIIYGELIK